MRQNIYTPTMEVNAAPQLLGYKHSSRYIPLCIAGNYDNFIFELSLYNVVFSKANLEITCANVFIIVIYFWFVLL